MTPPNVAHVIAAADVACQTCAHTWQSHDATAMRFCNATLHGGHSRRCVCRSENDRKKVLQPMPR